MDVELILDNGKTVILNVEAEEVDAGIGQYEFWGQKCVDNRKSVEVKRVTHDEELTDDERKEVEEYLESREFNEKVTLSFYEN